MKDYTQILAQLQAQLIKERTLVTTLRQDLDLITCETLSEVVSHEIDSSVGTNWMRCSPGLPKYVQSLEAKISELKKVLPIGIDPTEMTTLEAEAALCRVYLLLYPSSNTIDLNEIAHQLDEVGTYDESTETLDILKEDKDE